MTTITLAAVAGLIIGIALGATVAGLALPNGGRDIGWSVCDCPKSFIVG